MSTIRTRKPWWRMSASALVLGLILAACGGDETPDAAPDEVPADEEAPAEDEPDAEAPDDEAPDDEAAPPMLEPVGPVDVGTIAIPPIFAMLLPTVALEGGFYDKYNVEVNLRSMETGVDAARAVQGGDLDMAFSPTGPVMNFAGAGVDVAALAGLDNVSWLVGSTNPEVDSCEALAGENIAVDSVGGARYNALQVVLHSCDLTTDDVDVTSLPGAAAIQAVAVGQLDTAVAHIDDTFVIEEQGGVDMHVVALLNDIDPMLHNLVFWTLRDSIEQNREAYVRVLAAHIEATRFINDPANEDDVVQKALVTGHSEEVIRASLPEFIALELWPVDRHGLGEDMIEATIETQVGLGNMDAEDAPDYADVVDTSLWLEAFDLVDAMN